MFIPLKNINTENYKHITICDNANFLYAIYDSTVIRYDVNPQKIGIIYNPPKWFDYNKIITNKLGNIVIIYNNIIQDNEKVQLLISLDYGVTWNTLKDEITRPTTIDCFFKTQTNLPNKTIDDILIVDNTI